MKSLAEIVLYPSFWAIGFHRVAHFLYGLKAFFLARLIASFARLLTGIEIHPGAVIGKYCFIDHGMGVVIGETSVIGENATIYHGVTLGSTGKRSDGRRHPVLGDNILIGAYAQLIGAINIGDGAIIGAGSVVLKDVAANETVVGNPARRLVKKIKN